MPGAAPPGPYLATVAGHPIQPRPGVLPVRRTIHLRRRRRRGQDDEDDEDDQGRPLLAAPGNRPGRNRRYHLGMGGNPQVSRPYDRAESKRVAITGSSGLIGTALTASLRADGHQVVRLSLIHI